jgi:hypothetical protein
LRLEGLERRTLMAGDTLPINLDGPIGTPAQCDHFAYDDEHPLHNAANPLDVDGDGFVRQNDAKLVIDALNRIAARSPSEVRFGCDVWFPRTTNMLDVDGDGVVSPIDAHRVINALKRQGAGESPDAAIVPNDCSLEPEAPTAASQSTGASGPIAASAVDAQFDEPFAPSEERSTALPPAGASATVDEAEDGVDESLDTSCVDSVFESLGAEGADGAAGQDSHAVASVSLEFPWAVDEELGTPLEEEGL